MTRRGIALVLSLIVIVVLSIFGVAIISRSVSESRLTQRYMESTQAFWLAEAGINRALNELRSDYSTTGSNLWPTNLGAGRYYANVTADGQDRVVDGIGVIPASGTPSATRSVRATMSKVANIPPNFYDNAIYSGGNVVLNGSSFEVEGNVRYADTISGNTGRITGGDTIADPSINPLAHLDFDQLRSISIAQNNYVPASVRNPSFPTSFWYDEAQGIPNVIFIESGLTITGNKTYGGFFVVGGEVVYDVSIAGTAEIEGAIYSLGNVSIRGSAEIEGGIWSGRTATIGGNADIDYNATYMAAISNLGINTVVQIILWEDTQNPYSLVP